AGAIREAAARDLLPSALRVRAHVPRRARVPVVTRGRVRGVDAMAGDAGVVGARVGIRAVRGDRAASDDAPQGTEGLHGGAAVPAVRGAEGARAPVVITRERRDGRGRRLLELEHLVASDAARGIDPLADGTEGDRARGIPDRDLRVLMRDVERDRA